MDILEILGPVLYDLFHLVIIVVAGFAVTYIRKRIAAEKLELISAIAQDAVLFTQQVYWHLDGEAKYDAAMERISYILRERGIKVDPAELKMFIESAVKQFKKEFAEQW